MGSELRQMRKHPERGSQGHTQAFWPWKYEQIVAAVGGDEKAMEKIIRHYDPMIEAQSGGDQEVREYIIAELRTAIRHYDLCDDQKNRIYLLKQAMRYSE